MRRAFRKRRIRAPFIGGDHVPKTGEEISAPPAGITRNNVAQQDFRRAQRAETTPSGFFLCKSDCIFYRSTFRIFYKSCNNPVKRHLVDGKPDHDKLADQLPGLFRPGDRRIDYAVGGQAGDCPAQWIATVVDLFYIGQ
jgi:hypothetical protein